MLLTSEKLLENIHLCLVLIINEMNNVLSPQDHFYVVCDAVGTPFLYFSSDGALVKEVSRSPYGHITYDSNPEVRSPIGMFGGIQVFNNFEYLNCQDNLTFIGVLCNSG